MIRPVSPAETYLIPMKSVFLTLGKGLYVSMAFILLNSTWSHDFYIMVAVSQTVISDAKSDCLRHISLEQTDQEHVSTRTTQLELHNSGTIISLFAQQTWVRSRYRKVEICRFMLTFYFMLYICNPLCYWDPSVATWRCGRRCQVDAN